MNEKEFRKRIFKISKRMGCYFEAKSILDKYDNLLKRCTSEDERKCIGIMGITELHKLWGCSEALIVNEEVILPAKKE